jgi:hypothetical protein
LRISLLVLHHLPSSDGFILCDGSVLFVLALNNRLSLVLVLLDEVLLRFEVPAPETLASADRAVQALDGSLLFVSKPVLHVAPIWVGEYDLLDFVNVLLQLKFFSLNRVQFRDWVS